MKGFDEVVAWKDLVGGRPRPRPEGPLLGILPRPLGLPAPTPDPLLSATLLSAETIIIRNSMNKSVKHFKKITI